MQEFLRLSKEDQKLAIEQTAASKGWAAYSDATENVYRGAARF